jgi:integrating conjugative element protein (TIGR03757 family)
MNNASNEFKGARGLLFLLWVTFALLTLHTSDISAAKKYIPVQPDNIKLFYTDAKKIKLGKKTNPLKKEMKVERYNMDTVFRIESLISAKLPKNKKKAQKIALQRVTNMKQEWIDAMKQGYTGLVLAKTLKLTKLPAIVITYKDEMYVVYGEYYADVALVQFQKHMKKLQKTNQQER